MGKKIDQNPGVGYCGQLRRSDCQSSDTESTR